MALPNPRPQPGDILVVLDDNAHYAANYGTRAVIDTNYRWRDDILGSTFAYSAYRPLEGGYVSCSGGPCPIIDEGSLIHLGQTEARFWHWKDRPRAGGGVDYTATVELFGWVGNRPGFDPFADDARAGVTGEIRWDTHPGLARYRQEQEVAA